MDSNALRNYVGKHLKFTFRNGVEVYAAIEAVYPEAGEVKLVKCGPSDVKLGELGEGLLPESLAHPESFLLVPSMVAKVKEIKRKAELAAGAAEPEEFIFAC